MTSKDKTTTVYGYMATGWSSRTQIWVAMTEHGRTVAYEGFAQSAEDGIAAISPEGAPEMYAENVGTPVVFVALPAGELPPPEVFERHKALKSALDAEHQAIFPIKIPDFRQRKIENEAKKRAQLEHAFMIGWGIRGSWEMCKSRTTTDEEWEHLVKASVDSLQGISTYDHSLMSELDLDGRRIWIGRRIWKAIRR